MKLTLDGATDKVTIGGGVAVVEGDKSFVNKLVDACVLTAGVLDEKILDVVGADA